MSEHPASIDHRHTDPLQVAQPAPRRKDRPEVTAQVARRARAIEYQIVRRLFLVQVEDVRAGIQLDVGNAPALERGKYRAEPIRMLIVNSELRH